MPILNTTISRLLQQLARQIARCALGADAGSKRIHSPTRLAVGHQGVFPPQVRAQVTAIACSLPKQSQVPLSRWSRAELARHVAQAPTLPPISASTVGRWLKAERIRPWRYHAWQHIHEPETFLQRARPVLQAYGQARALLSAGTWLVSVDEKTSIQAREGELPPRPTCPGKPMLYEARYHRRGFRHLFAGLSVADGKVYATCRQRKCFVDFQAFVQQEIIPEALRRQVHTVIFILDNGTTHAPKQLEDWLREQEHVAEEQLHFQVHWLPPNASWLDQIEIWFSLLQRKHLQPNHFLSTDDLEASLGEYIAYYNQTAKPINWTYTVEKLEQKLGRHL
jgi:transposase